MGRVVNRRQLREQADQAEEQDQTEDVETDAEKEPAPKRKRRAKALGPAKPRKPRAKKAPTRMRARWGVFDGAMKQIAIFDYNQHAAAQERLSDLLANKKGIHFMQIVKEPMPDAPVAVVATN